MKKFSFSLESVLNYKDQVLDARLTEHGVILAEVRRQEEYLAQLRHEYDEFVQDFQKEKENGITIQKIMTYDSYARRLSENIEHEEGVLKVIRRKEEVKRQQVVDARKEAATIEKLKEKKRKAYDREVAKSEEQFIEEFVSNARGRAHISG